VVGGYKIRLCMQMRDPRPEDQDYYGVHLCVEGGPYPCHVNFSIKLIHHDGQPASAMEWTDGHTYTETRCDQGPPASVPAADLTSLGNNPYVRDGYVTFRCAFKIVDGNA
jgi:hypothetical protein